VMGSPIPIIAHTGMAGIRPPAIAALGFRPKKSELAPTSNRCLFYLFCFGVRSPVFPCSQYYKSTQGGASEALAPQSV